MGHIFSKQKSQFLFIFEGHEMEHLVYFMVILVYLRQLDVFYRRLVYFIDIWYNLWSFVTYFHLLVCYTVKKSGSPYIRA
jgi:hypothetical protein